MNDAPKIVSFQCRICQKQSEGHPNQLGLAPHFCAKCQVAHDKAVVEREEKLKSDQKDFAMRSRLAQASIPFYSLQFPARHQDAIDKLLETGRGLFIWGPTGRGKTVLAAHIGRQFVLSCKGEALFLTANRLILEAQQTYSPTSSISPLSYIAELAAKKLLIIDDFGRQKFSDDAKRIIFDVIDRRVKMEVTTVFTSEKSLKVIAQLMDQAFVGRILESCDRLHLDGPDFRISSQAGEEVANVSE